MGSPFSKSPNPLADSAGNGDVAAAAATTGSTEDSSNSVEIVSELSSYDAACLWDPEARAPILRHNPPAPRLPRHLNSRRRCRRPFPLLRHPQGGHWLPTRRSSLFTFTEEFFQAFQSVYRQQLSMLEKLQKKKNNFEMKLKSMKAWRKVSAVIFVSVFAVVLICSVVAAAVSAPAVIIALAVSAAVAMGPMGKWLNSLWTEYLDALKGQQEVLTKMQVGTFVTISDLESIRVLVDQLEVQISSLLQNVDFALREEEAVKFVVEEIKKKVEMFMKSIKALGKQADQCSRDIRKARTVVLQGIIRHPN